MPTTKDGGYEEGGHRFKERVRRRVWRPWCWIRTKLEVGS